MARYVLPDMTHLTCNVFRGALFPAGPALAGVACNLAPGPTQLPSGMLLRLPAFVDVRDSFNAGGADVIEVPAGSGRFYNVQMVDDFAKNYPNQHRFAVLAKRGVWPTPIP